MYFYLTSVLSLFKSYFLYGEKRGGKTFIVW